MRKAVDETRFRVIFQKLSDVSISDEPTYAAIAELAEQSRDIEELMRLVQETTRPQTRTFSGT